ncbi:MAG: hypothetical protein KKA81_13600 [Bacteroidetes bacterium]|nr:hypothetical protein [Bacteroidota bacterium]
MDSRGAGHNILIVIILFGIMIVYTLPVMGQIYGCTDPQATNYDPAASLNDGSCLYDPTSLDTPVFMSLPGLVNETSGLIFWNEGLWTHNDSGGDAAIYKIDTATGEIIQWVFIDNADNTDWEDIDQDEYNIYIGDFGNNSGSRQDLHILVISKEDILTSLTDTIYVNANVIWFSFADQQVFTPNHNNHNYDCEAMISVGDSLYLFSKNWLNKYSRIYRVPKIPGTYQAEVLDSLNAGCLVTGASCYPETGFIALTGYSTFIPMFWMLWDYQGTDFLSGNKRLITMPYILGAQTEGACVISQDGILISAEASQFFNQQVYYAEYGQYTGNYTGNVESAIKDIDIQITPNPVNNRIIIEIPDARGFEPEVSILNQVGSPCDVLYSIFTKTGNGYRIIVDADQLKDGFYAVKVGCGPIVKTGKLIKN